ncbi:MAG: transporter [Flavobacteriaceae bacterium]
MTIIVALTYYKNFKTIKKVFIGFDESLFSAMFVRYSKLISLKRSFSIKQVLTLVFMLSIGTEFIQAQYTEVINSNRPGFSESPYSVGTGIYQFESNIFFRNTSAQPTFSRPQSLGLNLAFRTSFFFERLELNLNASYQRDKFAFKNIFTSHYFDSGISELTIGAKYLVYHQEYKDKSKEIRSWKKRNAFDWKRAIPSVAVYAGANTDFVSEAFKTGKFSPKVGVLLQNDFSESFNLITNIFYDRIGTDAPELSYIATATINFDEKWSIFLENQGAKTKFISRGNVGTGVAYLYNRNIQLNSSLRLVVEGNATGLYSSLGVSYRIDRHKDKLISDGNGETLPEGKETRYAKKKRKGFFGRLFGKVTGIFKKKDKSNKGTTKEGEKETRKRPRRVRKKPSKIKPVKKKKKKKDDSKEEDNNL